MVLNAPLLYHQGESITLMEYDVVEYLLTARERAVFNDGRVLGVGVVTRDFKVSELLSCMCPLNLLTPEHRYVLMLMNIDMGPYYVHHLCAPDPSFMCARSGLDYPLL